MNAVRAILIVVSIVLMTNQVSATDYKALGVGVAVSCGAWLEAREPRNVGALQQEAWVLGYVSAANATIVARGQNDFLIGLDAPAIFVWLNNYCREHPLKRLVQASDALISELMRRAAGAGTKTK